MFALNLLLLSTLAFVDLGLDFRQGVPVELDYPWVYLRDGQVVEPDERVVEIIAVGDIMLGRGVAGVEDVFLYAAPWLRAADLSVGNFEGAIVGGSAMGLDHGSNISKLERASISEKTIFEENGATHAARNVGGVDERNIALDYTPYKLIIPPGALENLHATGFDLLSLANNHSLDAGIAGLQETISGLKASGIEPLGVSPAPTIHDAGSFRIAFLALNLIPGGIVSDIVAAQEMVQDAREQADVVIVSIHWGLEYHLEPSPAQAQLAKQLSQAGADLVLGHHPHVVQPIEILSREEGDSQHDTFVAYSLGNFVFDQFDEHTNEGLALRILVDQDGLRAVQALPVEAGPRPRLASLQESNALLARVSPPPRRVGYACDVRECWSIPVPQEERTGIFWTGEIDLTGDGVPETIRRSAQSVTIYQDGKAVWRSPPEWRVLDVAMGDPNDDGRAEVLLALNKPGREGTLTSHPFILGYRGGIYRVLWGGSAVSDPLLEVELGDLDGDAVQELIVLERPHGGNAQTVSVWRWHGWGFSQLWRSPEGSYQDVILLPGGMGELPKISTAAREPID